MDLAQMKAAVTMEGVLSGAAALELIAEVERGKTEIVRMAKEWLQEPEPDNGTVGELDVDEITVMIAGLVDKVESLTALCDGYRGEIDALKAKCEDRRNMLEDVVNELDLSDGMIEQHGPMGTAPATLVRLILERKDREIAMLKAGMVPIGDESALTRARAEGMEEERERCCRIIGEVASTYCGTIAGNQAEETIATIRATKGDSDEG